MLPRRSLFAIAASAAALALLATPTHRAHAVGADVPLFDAHVHWSENAHEEIPLERALQILDKAGVRMAAVSSTSDEATIKLYRADPKRVVPMLRPYRTRSDMGGWHNDASIPPYLAERLKLGVHKGIGEFHLFGGQTSTAVVRRLTELAVQRNLYLHAHSDDLAVVELFTLEPRIKVIWAHAGMSAGPTVVGPLLDRYPSLWVDLALRNGDVAPGGTLDPAWRALFIRHPDRFLAGTDTWVTSRWEDLQPSMRAVQDWLAQLPPAVAEKIAHGNGERLFPSR